MNLTLETLPVELVADVLSELDIASLIVVSGLSRRLRTVVSDVSGRFLDYTSLLILINWLHKPSLNPWRRAMFESLQSEIPDPHLVNLSVRNIVPRQNWIEVFSKARPEWILYQATLPNLKDAEWEECFSRRFLPGWKKWKKEGKWKPAFLAYVL